MAQSPKFRDALRRLENPYATLDAEPLAVEAPELTADASRREEFRRVENPYAWDYFFDQSTPPTSSSNRAPIAPKPKVAPGLSQSQFEQQARAIFRPYIPAAENGRLRAHHREFITRNKARSPQSRFQLIAVLSKYDLSGTPGLNPQFNREQDTLTRAKLAEIEKLIEESN